MGPRLLRALLHRVAETPPDSDAELLRQFAATGDEPAFAELVRRYGALVWGQCRNLLPSEADAEDAFQATFLVLARRPGTIRSAVGPYLHGVAYRVCLNARRLAGRRKKREAGAAVPEAERPVAESAWDAALATVHDELHRLPDPQREAFVLCVLEGRGLTDAAGHLGVKLGTLSARLSRAKQAIMDRLTAKGVVAGVAAVASLAPAGVSAATTAKAVELAVGSMSGSAVVPQTVLALTYGVARMVTSKLKLLAAGVLLACGLGLSVGTGLVATAQDAKPILADKVKEAEARLNKLLAEEKAQRLRAEEAERTARAAQKEAEERLRAETDAQRAAENLAKAQAELVRRAQDVATPEFKYVPIAGVLSEKDFEKMVVDNEKGGYVFVGSAPLSGQQGREKAPDGPITTLVFRKVAEKAVANPPKALLGEKLRQYEADYERLIAQEQLAKTEAERQLRARWDQLAVERDRMLAESKQLLDKEARLRAEIDALQERLKQQPVAPPPAVGGNPQPEKMYSVEFDAVPWPKVVEWLANELQLTQIDYGKGKPDGTCTLKLGRKVTAGELVDVLNEALASQKLTLIRGVQVLRLWPTNKPFAHAFVRLVRVEDLPKYGKSELVRVILPLKGIAAADAEKLAKKLLSPVGGVTAVGAELVVTDRVAEVKAIRAAIEK